MWASFDGERGSVGDNFGPSATRDVVGEAFNAGGLHRELGAGDRLFAAGTPKTHVYRVESGLIYVFADAATGPRRSVGLSVAGELVGLGALDRHVFAAEAVGAAVVSCLPRACVDELIAVDPLLAHRHSTATKLEWATLRKLREESTKSAPLKRVAALLCALAAQNSYEGRTSDVVTDDVTCGFVAETAGLDIDTLEAAMVELNRRGLVDAIPGGGLRLRDRSALETVADGRDPVAP